MKRWLLLIAVLSLVAAACGGSSAEPETSDTAAVQPTADAGDTADVEDDGATTTSTAESDGGTDTSGVADTSTTAAATPEPEGDPAPDFTLALANGDNFSLSAEENPVYLVFWAEW